MKVFEFGLVRAILIRSVWKAGFKAKISISGVFAAVSISFSFVCKLMFKLIGEQLHGILVFLN